MGRVRVVSNSIPDIIRRLPTAVDGAVDDTATSLRDTITARAWKDTGVAVRTTKANTTGRPMHSTVGIGVPRGRGFYVMFLEDGTHKMAARPVVRPAAHQHEPILTRLTSLAVVRACR